MHRSVAGELMLGLGDRTWSAGPGAEHQQVIFGDAEGQGMCSERVVIEPGGAFQGQLVKLIAF